MSRFFTIAAAFILSTALLNGVAHAQSGSEVMQTKVKVALNEMVQDVHSAPTAEAKRLVMDRFVAKIHQGTSVIARIPFLSEDNHAALQQLQTRFDGYTTMLHGSPSAEDAEAVADADLDAFASFMQNDLEQAQGGGVYLSTGAIIILLLILLIIL